ncbi:MAG TPA: carbohydrate porin, partial [Urbifossiella sp.]|nr:carbohydrate porin [Urbifossiella sp.]
MPSPFRTTRAGGRFVAATLGLLAVAGAGAAQPAVPPAELPPVTASPPDALPGGEAVDRLAATGAAAPAAPPAPPAPPPFGGPLLERQKLTGDWFGVRDQLRDHGITWDISSTNFYQGVTRGGLNTGFEYGGRADYLFNVNGEKAGLWKGLFIDLHAETLYGSSINGATGSLLPPSLAQTLPIPGGEVTALTGVKVTQALSENVLVYLGKINTADGFNQPF